jgi:hypothetical protein
MSLTKILLIFLIIVIVLFVVFVAWGAKKNSSEPAPKANTFNSGKYPILESFNSVLAGFGPKFEVNQLQPPVAAFDLQTQPQYSVKVLGDSKHKFRQAKFIVQPSKGCADVEYTAAGPTPSDVRNPQKSADSNDSNHPKEFTFTVFEGGGTLTLVHTPPYASPCKVTLE